MSDIRLRSVQPTDLPGLACLRRDVELQDLLLAYPSGGKIDDVEVAAWIERRTSDAHGCFLTVVDGTSAVVGFAQITRIHRQGAHGYFGLALVPQARSRNIGRAALTALVAHARASSLTKLLGEVRSDNAASLALCSRLGFRQVGLLHAHYKGRDVVLLEKLL